MVSIFLFTANINYYFDFSYASPIPSYFLSYVYIPVINICMLFAILIEIVINIERISNFKLRFRSITRQKPKNIGIIFLLVCPIINVQYFFNQEPKFIDLKLNSTVNRINYIESTEYILSLSGIILNFCTYFIRDVILLLMQCLLAIISVYLMKNYFKSKKNILLTESEPSPDEHPATNLNSSYKMPSINNSQSVNKNITRSQSNYYDCNNDLFKYSRTLFIDFIGYSFYIL